MSTNYLDDLEEILNQKPPQNYFMDFMEWFAEMNNDTINKFIKRDNLRTIQKLAEFHIKTFTDFRSSQQFSIKAVNQNTQNS